MGVTKIFFRQKVAEDLEKRRDAKLAHFILLLQRCTRLWMTRLRYRRMRAACISLQAKIRRQLTLSTLGDQLGASMFLQAEVCSDAATTRQRPISYSVALREIVVIGIRYDGCCATHSSLLLLGTTDAVLHTLPIDSCQA